VFVVHSTAVDIEEIVQGGGDGCGGWGDCFVEVINSGVDDGINSIGVEGWRSLLRELTVLLLTLLPLSSTVINVFPLLSLFMPPFLRLFLDGLDISLAALNDDNNELKSDIAGYSRLSMNCLLALGKYT